MLTERGYPVRVLVRRPGRSGALPAGVDVVPGDVTDPETMTGFVHNLDVCIHLAALVGDASRREYRRVNVGGTENVCRSILVGNPTCRLVYASTISVLKVRPLWRWLSSDYGLSKYDAEKLVRGYMRKRRLAATIIYPGLIYGGSEKVFLPRLVAAVENGTVKLIRGGEVKAPLIHVDELCELFIKAVENPVSIGKRYISVRGLDIGIHEVIRTIARETGSIVPEKTYSKALFFLLAVIVGWLYKVFRSGRRPFITKTAVDILSISLRDVKQRYNDPGADLGWRQDVSRTFFVERLREILHPAGGP
jgi:nucleoside-diphosphate-sugar epimerase